MKAVEPGCSWTLKFTGARDRGSAGIAPPEPWRRDTSACAVATDSSRTFQVTKTEEDDIFGWSSVTLGWRLRTTLARRGANKLSCREPGLCPTPR
jgi:hypothetical protein